MHIRMSTCTIHKFCCCSHNDPKQWAQSKWDEWFYEVLAEVRSAIVDLEKGRTPYFKWQPSSTRVPETFYEPLRKKGNASTAQSSKPKTKSSKKSQQQSTVELELVNIPLSTGTDVSVCIAHVCVVCTCTCKATYLNWSH